MGAATTQSQTRVFLRGSGDCSSNACAHLQQIMFIEICQLVWWGYMDTYDMLHVFRTHLYRSQKKYRVIWEESSKDTIVNFDPALLSNLNQLILHPFLGGGKKSFTEERWDRSDRCTEGRCVSLAKIIFFPYSRNFNYARRCYYTILIKWRKFFSSRLPSEIAHLGTCIFCVLIKRSLTRYNQVWSCTSPENVHWGIWTYFLEQFYS